MEEEIKIMRCYNSCPFFGNSMEGMECNHPYWEDKGIYENMIITQDNIREGKIPEKCPLKNEQLTIVYKLYNYNYAKCLDELWNLIEMNINGGSFIKSDIDKILKKYFAYF